MSDDLISRKWMMKQFCISENGRKIPEYDCDNFPVTISIKDVKDVIRKAPAAFDKEKVKQELEISSKLYSLNDRDCEFAIPQNIALEIVEKGGIE